MRDSHQDGEDEDRRQCERLCFHLHVDYNGLHFPQMKLASEKPPEAVLEGEARHPSSRMGIWPDRFFFCFLRPCIMVDV